uniref:Uncharacterized protein n=2 Tax=Aegilops tauschii subsp. strangulata TaxID=200361 RepID=A0A453ITB5_AEGTS
MRGLVKKCSHRVYTKEQGLYAKLLCSSLVCVCLCRVSSWCVFMRDERKKKSGAARRRPWRAAASAACAADMEASAAARGERVAKATRDESAAVRCDVVRAKSTVVAERRRSRRTCMVAQRLRWRGVAAWRCCAAVDAAAVQGNKPWRRAGRDRCVLWVHIGRVGRVRTAGARTSERLKLGGGVCRRCARVRARVRLHPSGVCRWRLPWRTRRRRAVSVWCGRARRARRVRAGRAGCTGAVGLVGRVGSARDVRGAEGRQACVAGEEGARCMSPGS